MHQVRNDHWLEEEEEEKQLLMKLGNELIESTNLDVFDNLMIDNHSLFLIDTIVS